MRAAMCVSGGRPRYAFVLTDPKSRWRLVSVSLTWSPGIGRNPGYLARALASHLSALWRLRGLLQVSPREPVRTAESGSIRARGGSGSPWSLQRTRARVRRAREPRALAGLADPMRSALQVSPRLVEALEPC